MGMLRTQGDFANTSGGVASQGNSDSTPHMLDILDNEINSLMPVYRLPLELLSIIFAELVALQSHSLYFERRYTLEPGWMTVSHVSHHWREVALHQPSLWTTISASLGQRWMEEMLVRSKSLPLTLKLDVEDAGELYALTEHISRTVHMHLQIEDAVGLEKPQSLLRLQAPILETCNVVTSDEGYKTPVDLFANAAPRLCALKLEVGSVQWTCPIFAGLVSLSVSVLDEGHWLSSTAKDSYRAQLVEALARMTKLETLDLVYCLPEAEPGDALDLTHEPGVIVPLPSLKSLRVTGTTVDIAAFLKSISIPSSSRLSITFVLCWSDGGHDVRAFAPLLPRLLRFLDKPAMWLAIRASKHGDDYEFALWTSVRYSPDKSLFPAETSQASVPEPSVRITGVFFAPVAGDGVDAEFIPVLKREAFSAVRDAWFGALPLRDIQVLDIADDVSDWEQATWLSIFDRLQDLQHLRVNHELDGNLPESLVAPSGQPTVPHLKTITVVDRSSKPDLDGKRTFLQKLIKSLIKRKGLAAPLAGVYLQGHPRKFRMKVKHLVYLLGIEKLVPVFQRGHDL